MGKSLLKGLIKEDAGVSDKSFTSFLHGTLKLNALINGVPPEEYHNDLLSFMTENTELAQPLLDLKRTLFKHWKKGTYATPLAEQAWSRVVDMAAKKYSSAVINEERLWEDFFPSKVRKGLTEKLEQQFYNELKHGQIDIEELFNER